MITDQRTDPRRLELDCVKRIKTCKLGVKLGSRVPVEEGQRALRSRIPLAVDGTGETADATEFALYGLGDIGLVDIGLARLLAQRGDLGGIVSLDGRDSLGIARDGILNSRLIPGERSRYCGFGCSSLPFGLGRLFLRRLLCLLGGNAGVFRRLELRSRLLLVGALGALGRQPRLLLFGLPRLLDRCDACILGFELVKLQLGQISVVPVRMLGRDAFKAALLRSCKANS